MPFAVLLVLRRLALALVAKVGDRGIQVPLHVCHILPGLFPQPVVLRKRLGVLLFPVLLVGSGCRQHITSRGRGEGGKKGRGWSASAVPLWRRRVARAPT